MHSWITIILCRWYVQKISVCCCGWYQVPGSFYCQYNGSFLLVLAGDLFKSFCAASNNFACFVIIFGDSIFLYCFATDFKKCFWYAVSLYCHFVLRVEVLWFVLVLHKELILLGVETYYVANLIARVSTYSCLIWN